MSRSTLATTDPLRGEIDAARVEHYRQLDECGLRPRQHGDFRVGVQLDAVERAVPVGDRLAERRNPSERRIAVRAIFPRDLGEAFDDVRRRPDLGVPATKVDQLRPVGRRRSRDAGQELREVLRGKPVESRRPGSHGAILVVENGVEDEVVQLSVVCHHHEAGARFRLAAPEGDRLHSVRGDREADILIVARHDEASHVDSAPDSPPNRSRGREPQ